LSPYTQAGEVIHKRLTVYASNGAVAAKVKLLLPSLLTKLQKHGLEVTSIRVQVQVQSSARKPQKPVRKLSATAANELKKLADNLDKGSSLASTLNKLAARSRDSAE
ncbi:MAG: DciA family protein, partial [Methylophilaceae bacterium]|nr:DciA family protein [Methylophilaceae bacterium]